MFLLISVHPVIQFDVLLIFCHIQTASLDDTKPSTVFDYNTGEKKSIPCEGVFETSALSRDLTPQKARKDQVTACCIYQKK